MNGGPELEEIVRVKNMIQISGQYGDPKAPDFFFPLQKKLKNLSKKYLTGNYFESITKLQLFLEYLEKPGAFVMLVLKN